MTARLLLPFRSRFSVLTGALLVAGALLAPLPALAVIPVTVDNCWPMSGVPNAAPVCASEATAAAQYQYLSSGVNTNIMGMAGGDGVVELLRKLADNSNQGNESQVQNMPNEDLAARAREADLAARQAVAAATQPISSASCNDGTIGGGLGGGGGAAAAAKQSVDVTQSNMAQGDLSPKEELAYVGAIASSSDFPSYCTQADVDNKVPRCTAVGSLPAANTNPDVLVEGATAAGGHKNFSIPWPTSTSTNDPYPYASGFPQFNAAMAYINMAKPTPAPIAPSSAYQSVAGKAYLLEQRRYNSRVLAVENALMAVVKDSAAMSSSSTWVQQVWNDNTAGQNLKQDYQDVYGYAAPPAPSERELMELMVRRQFTQTNESSDMAASGDALNRRILEMEKINAFVNMKVAERMDMQNILLANILSNQIDPVTRDELLKKSQGAAHAGTGGN